MNSGRGLTTRREPALRGRSDSTRSDPARGCPTLQRDLRTFVDPLRRRLLDGERLTLFGPRGGGKSSVLRALEAQLRDDAVPCAYVPVIGSLEHITHALECAYPAVPTVQLGRCAGPAPLVERGRPARRQAAARSLQRYRQCHGVVSEAAARAGRGDTHGGRHRERGPAARVAGLGLRGAHHSYAGGSDRYAAQVSGGAAKRLRLRAFDSRVRTALVAVALGGSFRARNCHANRDIGATRVGC
jgi:ABC-type glutathione transport system ATPase component